MDVAASSFWESLPHKAPDGSVGMDVLFNMLDDMLCDTPPSPEIRAGPYARQVGAFHDAGAETRAHLLSRIVGLLVLPNPCAAGINPDILNWLKRQPEERRGGGGGGGSADGLPTTSSSSTGPGHALSPPEAAAAMESGYGEFDAAAFAESSSADALGTGTPEEPGSAAYGSFDPNQIVSPLSAPAPPLSTWAVPPPRGTTPAGTRIPAVSKKLFSNFVARFGPFEVLLFKAAACFFDVGTATLCGWYHGELGRPEARKRLSAGGLVNGKFLVRVSGKHPECFTLAFFKVEGTRCDVRNVLMYNNGIAGYALERRAAADKLYTSIAAFVQKHQQAQYKLREACDSSPLRAIAGQLLELEKKQMPLLEPYSGFHLSARAAATPVVAAAAATSGGGAAAAPSGAAYGSFDASAVAAAAAAEAEALEAPAAGASSALGSAAYGSFDASAVAAAAQTVGAPAAAPSPAAFPPPVPVAVAAAAPGGAVAGGGGGGGDDAYGSFDASAAAAVPQSSS